MKLIVLDRDGVINYDSHNYVRSPEEWLPIESSLKAIALLHQAGYTIVVVTNQSGLARGYYDELTLTKIHEKMRAAVHAAGGKISQVYHCPHLPTDDCACRKPRPGMLQQVAADYQVDLNNRIMIGDKLSDIQAAQAMAMKPIYVCSGLKDESKDPAFNRIETFPDLYVATTAILSAS